MRLGIYYERIPYLGPKHYQLWTKLFFFSNQNNIWSENIVTVTYFVAENPPKIYKLKNVYIE